MGALFEGSNNYCGNHYRLPGRALCDDHGRDLVKLTRRLSADCRRPQDKKDCENGYEDPGEAASKTPLFWTNHDHTKVGSARKHEKRVACLVEEVVWPDSRSTVGLLAYRRGDRVGNRALAGVLIFSAE